jgi:hypothetical protein
LLKLGHIPLSRDSTAATLMELSSGSAGKSKLSKKFIVIDEISMLLLVTRGPHPSWRRLVANIQRLWLSQTRLLG